MDLNARFVEVVEFNTMAGFLTDVSSESLLAQARNVKEEANELFDAINNNDPPENVLKEMCDTLVTSFGMLAALTKKGFDTDKAFKLVNENNMSKFCDTPMNAYYTSAGYNATEGVNTAVKPLVGGLYGVFDENGKLRKPIGYEPVDKKELCKCCPPKDGSICCKEE